MNRLIKNKMEWKITFYLNDKRFKKGAHLTLIEKFFYYFYKYGRVYTHLIIFNGINLF